MATHNNFIPDLLLLILMLDAFAYLFYRSWQVHKVNLETSAFEDKIVYTMLSTLFIWSMIYLGRLFDIDTPLFNMLSYLGNVGLFIVAYVIGLMAHDRLKQAHRKFKKQAQSEK
jgi:uncharacterized membrane protein